MEAVRQRILLGTESFEIWDFKLAAHIHSHLGDDIVAAFKVKWIYRRSLSLAKCVSLLSCANCTFLLSSWRFYLLCEPTQLQVMKSRDCVSETDLERAVPDVAVQELCEAIGALATRVWWKPATRPLVEGKSQSGDITSARKLSRSETRKRNWTRETGHSKEQHVSSKTECRPFIIDARVPFSLISLKHVFHWLSINHTCAN